jgi:hypothetical protein
MLQYPPFPNHNGSALNLSILVEYFNALFRLATRRQVLPPDGIPHIPKEDSPHLTSPGVLAADLPLLY